MYNVASNCFSISCSNYEILLKLLPKIWYLLNEKQIIGKFLFLPLTKERPIFYGCLLSEVRISVLVP